MTLTITPDMITNEVVETIAHHPIIRMRVIQILRQKGVLPAEEPPSPPAPPLPLEELGIYIPMMAACIRSGLTTGQMRWAMDHKRVRWRDGADGPEVEVDTLDKYVSVRKLRLRQEAKRNRHPNGRARSRTKAVVRMDRVGRPMPSPERPPGALTHSEAAHMLGLGVKTVSVYLAQHRLTSAGRGWVTEESVRLRAEQRGISINALPQE